MTFEEFYKLNKDKIKRFLVEKAYMGLIKFVWNDGFRMGYGAAYYLPMSAYEKQVDSILKNQSGLDQSAIRKVKGT